ncbi:MAG: hypothetical protein JNM13_17690 [Hyphomicrobiaceae bacterium]|nr:hypothetical protein [Hyphomicrobiaceae bacterium]
MGKAWQAGLWYFLAIYALAFLMGTARVLVVAPLIGRTAATLIELPIVVGASWVGATWLARRFDLRRRSGRWPMALTGFVLLIAAELSLGVFGFGQRLDAILAEMATPLGLAGLAAQVLFGLMPVLVADLEPAARSGGG